MEIRRLRDNETELLKDFLYEAIFIPEGMQPPERTIIELPELVVYYENFGSCPADNCLVAEENGKVVGFRTVDENDAEYIMVCEL